MRWLAPSILCLLWEKPTHGYNLMGALPEVGFVDGGVDAAAVYRTLNLFEQQGLVSSVWDTSGSGAAKKLYTLTAAGKTELQRWWQVMREQRDTIDCFLHRLADLPDFIDQLSQSRK